jgi:hypothetical protein
MSSYKRRLQGKFGLPQGRALAAKQREQQLQAKKDRRRSNSEKLQEQQTWWLRSRTPQ